MDAVTGGHLTDADFRRIEAAPPGAVAAAPAAHLAGCARCQERMLSRGARSVPPPRRGGGIGRVGLVVLLIALVVLPLLALLLLGLQTR